MIIIQAPLRISLFGGGTDFPTYFHEEGGNVLSTAIDKYIFITIKHRFDDKLRVGWTQTDMVDTVDELRHELIREAFRLTGITQGVEISTMGDIPSQGSGLGSSSTVTVGALHAMHTLNGNLVMAEQLAQEACHIELDLLGKPIGVQDQYIAAYGGFRTLTFQPDGQVCTERVPISAENLLHLNESLMLFFTGVTRQSDTILTEQQANIADRKAILRQMAGLVPTATRELASGNIDAIGPLLDESWRLKQQLASRITNPTINEMYTTALRAGALGGKISGAGGGGFMLLYCPPEAQRAVRKALLPLQELPFRMERDGSKVIFNYRRA
jgi:D-glycero-alpha-D-manno-heptose-7-phosphate kinase